MSSANLSFLSGIIDYAGTFPPAKLSIDSTFRHGFEFKKTSQTPFLFRRWAFAIEDLLKITPATLFESGYTGDTLNICCIATKPVLTLSDWQNLLVEWSRLKKWQTQLCAYGVDVHFETLELKGSLEEMPSFQESVTLFLESSLDEFQKVDLKHLSVGFKIRTASRSSCPPEQLASCIAFAVEHQLPFKATQGLHHPFTHHEEYGFLNLLLALSLATHYGLERFGKTQIQSCLLEQAIVYQDRRFEFLEFSLTLEQLCKTRQFHQFTFGSCSVDEPASYLKGWTI